jgi:hypothetical protein
MVSSDWDHWDTMSSAKRHEAPTINLDTPGSAEKLKAVLAGRLSIVVLMKTMINATQIPKPMQAAGSIVSPQILILRSQLN